jgi:hypothetical protein
MIFDRLAWIAEVENETRPRRLTAGFRVVDPAHHAVGLAELRGQVRPLKFASAYARRTFAPFLLHVQSDRSKIVLDEQTTYWHEVETPYISFYAFEEVPAAFMEERGS